MSYTSLDMTGAFNGTQDIEHCKNKWKLQFSEAVLSVGAKQDLKYNLEGKHNPSIL